MCTVGPEHIDVFVLPWHDFKKILSHALSFMKSHFCIHVFVECANLEEMCEYTWGLC